MNEAEVKKIASLARLKIEDHEVSLYQAQFQTIFEKFEEIKEVNTEGVEPLVTPVEIEQLLRADEVEAGTPVDDVLANAPHKQGNLFNVPPVVG